MVPNVLRKMVVVAAEEDMVAITKKTYVAKNVIVKDLRDTQEAQEHQVYQEPLVFQEVMDQKVIREHPVLQVFQEHQMVQDQRDYAVHQVPQEKMELTALTGHKGPKVLLDQLDLLE